MGIVLKLDSFLKSKIQTISPVEEVWISFLFVSLWVQ